MSARRPMRADRVPHTMNAGKADVLLGYVRDFRAMACGAGRVQWRWGKDPDTILAELRRLLV